jgi:RHS repeat-associated protein
LGVFEFPMTLSFYYHDKETGNTYAMFRDAYDPRLGRFPQSDPIGLRGGVNLYLYANANPMSYTDPLGLQVAPAPPTVFPPPGAAGGANNAGSTSAIAKGIQNAINNLTSSSCPPCDPPVGTRCYKHDFGHAHGGLPADLSHFHFFVMEQIPCPSCQCVWKRQSGSRGWVDFVPWGLPDCEFIPSGVAQQGAT